MRKSFILLALLFAVISSCTVPQYTLGMNEKDFTASHKYNLDVVEVSHGRSVYKRTVEVDAQQRVTAYMYYYFADGKLVRMQREDLPVPAVVVVEQKKG